MNTKPTLLILAAGMGSRYGSLKQIDPVGPSGESIIDYSVYDAVRAGFGKLVFVIRKSIEKEFKEVFGEKFSQAIPVEYVFQELDNVPEGVEISPARVKPWGTGHAVLVAATSIQEPFAVINADDFYGAGSFQQLAEYLSPLTYNDTQHCLIGYQLGNTLSDYGSVSRGVCQLSPDDILEGVTERTKIQRQGNEIVFENEKGEYLSLKENTIVSMNMLGFAPGIFTLYKQYFEEFIAENSHQLKAEFYIPTVVNNMIQQGVGSVKVLKSNEKWFGVTYKQDKPLVVQKLQQLIKAGVYPEKLW